MMDDSRHNSVFMSNAGPERIRPSVPGKILMATKKKTSSAAKKKTAPSSGPVHTLAYEAAVKEFDGATKLLHAGDHAAAAKAFEKIATSCDDEPVLQERCDSFASICHQKLAAEPASPQNSEERYLQAVVAINNGDGDLGLRLLDEALQEAPASPKLLYARASAWSIKGNGEAAVSDLRQAIAAEPQLRFQAVNDPDFEPIREEPSFIDIIEPTPTGA